MHKRIVWLQLAAATFSFAFAAHTTAQSTWVGGTAGNLNTWTTSTNWSPSGVPGTTSDVIFSGTPTSFPNQPGGTTILKSISFASDAATFTGMNTSTEIFALRHSASFTAFTQASANAQTLNQLDVYITTAASDNVTATLDLSGTGGLTLTEGLRWGVGTSGSGKVFQIQGRGPLTVNGTFRGDLNTSGAIGGTSRNITLAGDSTFGQIVTFNPTSASTWTAINGITLAGRVTLNLPKPTTIDAGSITFASGAQNASLLITDSIGDTFNRNIIFTGGSISGGIQTIGVDQPGAGGATFSGDISTAGSNNTVALYAATDDLATFTGAMSGARPMHKTGPGAVELAPSASTISGKWTISDGLILTTNEANLGANPALFTADHITLNGGGIWATVNLEFNSNRGMTLGAAGGTFDTSAGTITLTSVVAGTAGGALTKVGVGTVIAAGAHTYDGPTNIRRGMIQLSGGSNRLPVGTVVNLGTVAAAHLGTLDLNGQNQQVAGLNSVAGTNATASNNTVTSATPATLTVGGSGTYAFGNGTNANSGVITGAIALVKQGTGAQILGDANTYTGGTTITGGVLRADNGVTGSATGSGAVAVNSGGTLGGSGTIVNTAGPVSINNAGTLSPGASIGNLTTNAQEWNAGGSYVWEIQDAAGGPVSAAGVNWDKTTVNGTLTVASAGDKFTIKLTTLNAGVAGLAANFNPAQSYTWTIAQATTLVGGPVDTSRFELDTSGFQNTFDGTFDIAASGSDVRLTYTPVPEPSGLTLVAGACALGLLRRRRRR